MDVAEGIAIFREGVKACQEKSYSEAFEYFKQAAELGLPEAEYNLGLMYEMGKGTEVDKAEALRWYEKAADQGDAEAQYCCANMYRNGEGTEKDSSIYLMWIYKAAEQGHSKASEIWDSMMASENWEDFMSVAVFEEGKRALLKENYEEAMGKFLIVPTHRAPADYMIGLMFENGLGTEADMGKAAYWYEEAAKQGHADAAYQLAKLYNKGKGVAEDLPKALMWAEKAAEQGHEKAQSMCGAMYYTGSGTAQDKAKALMWYEKVEEKGNASFDVSNICRSLRRELAEQNKPAPRRKKGLFGLF